MQLIITLYNKDSELWKCQTNKNIFFKNLTIKKNRGNRLIFN